MADFTAKIQAILDIQKIESSLNEIENRSINLKNVKISNFTFDTNKLPSTLQAQLNSHKFTIHINNIDTSSIGNQMQKAGNSAGQSFSQALVNKIQNAINTNGVNASISKVTAQFKKLSSMTIDTSAAHSSMQQIEADIQQLQVLQTKLQSSSSNSELIANWNQYNEVLQRVKNNMTIVSNEGTKMASTLSVATLKNQMESWLSKNTKATNTYREAVQNLITQLNSMNSAGGVSEGQLKSLTTSFKEVDAACTSAGLKGKTFGDSITSAFSSISKYVSASTLIYATVNALKQSVDTVIELDDALVDLQKTTEASYSELQEFYYEANDIAKEYGATTQEIIQSAADWSRLGYSLEDSELMSQYSSMFASISPGMDVDTATTGLVSTMKAKCMPLYTEMCT